jgi:hypothetical protein
MGSYVGGQGMSRVGGQALRVAAASLRGLGIGMRVGTVDRNKKCMTQGCRITITNHTTELLADDLERLPSSWAEVGLLGTSQTCLCWRIFARHVLDVVSPVVPGVHFGSKDLKAKPAMPVGIVGHAYGGRGGDATLTHVAKMRLRSSGKCPDQARRPRISQDHGAFHSKATILRIPEISKKTTARWPTSALSLCAA